MKSMDEEVSGDIYKDIPEIIRDAMGSKPHRQALMPIQQSKEEESKLLANKENIGNNENR